MALTDLQRSVCRLLAERRVASGDSYVAGGAALGEATGSERVSQDIDLFHDTAAAVAEGWEGDCGLLERAGYHVTPVRERPSFVEAVVTLEGQRVLVQWAADSAYRFFPLREHTDFGLVLHPLLPPEQVGRCIQTHTGELFRGGPLDARRALERDQLSFRPGSIRGVLPSVEPVD